MNEKNMRAAFQLFDKDGGGSIDASEVANVLGQNAASDQAVWDEVIREVDTNGDGQIDFEEFVTMMNKLANKHDSPQAIASARAAMDQE